MTCNSSNTITTSVTTKPSSLSPIRILLPPSLGLNHPLVPTTPVLLHGPTTTHDTLCSQTYRHVHMLVYDMKSMQLCILLLHEHVHYRFIVTDLLSIQRDYVD